MNKLVINWDKIKAEYEEGATPNTAIATKFGVSESGIRGRARKEKWKKQPKKSIKRKIDKNSFLNGAVAKSIFNEIKEELEGYLTIMDEPLLVAYCNQYARYLELEKRVVNEGEVIVSKNGNPYFNPTYTALLSAIKTMTSLSKEFGLTIAGRKKVGIVIDNIKKDEHSLFNLMKGHGEEEIFHI